MSFKITNGKITAFVPIKQLLSKDEDIEKLLEKAPVYYKRFLADMKSTLNDIEYYRKNKRLLPARMVWRIGNVIFSFVELLRSRGIQIDGLYEHVLRDLGIKRKWLEKAIILRRYIPAESDIPTSLSWGYFEKGTRRKAEQLMRGNT